MKVTFITRSLSIRARVRDDVRHVARGQVLFLFELEFSLDCRCLEHVGLDLEELVKSKSEVERSQRQASKKCTANNVLFDPEPV